MLLVLLAMGLGSAKGTPPPPSVMPDVSMPVVNEDPSGSAEDWLKWGATAIGQGGLAYVGGQIVAQGASKAKQYWEQRKLGKEWDDLNFRLGQDEISSLAG